MLTSKTGAPTLIKPEDRALERLAAIALKFPWTCASVSLDGTVDWLRAGAGVVMIDSTMIEPFLTPTIFSLPGSIPKKAQMFVMKVVGPVLL